jgi:hypothetical protein
MSENTILVGDLNVKSYQWNNGNENSHGRLLEDCMTQNQLICFYLYDYIILPLVLVSLVEHKDTKC